MMIAAHLSWCAELSRSTDAHQARLGMLNYYWAPGRIRSILCGQRRANLHVQTWQAPPAIAHLPSYNSKTKQGRRSSLASIAAVIV